MREKITKEEIIEIAGYLFRINGFSNTSMSDIANKTGLFKGSLYHHFETKEDILIAAIKSVHRYFTENIFSIAYKNESTKQQKWNLLLDAIYSFFENRECGCLMGNILLELPNADGEIAKSIVDYFDEWVLTFDYFLSLDNSQLSKELVGNIQGALLMQKIYGGQNDILKSTINNIKNTIRPLS